MLLGKRLHLAQPRRAAADLHLSSLRGAAHGGRVTLAEYVKLQWEILREYGLIKGEKDHATE